jgi:putative hydrolase of the HAD superfamily
MTAPAASGFDHVELITFDLDDTLWPCHDVIRAAECACFDWLCEYAPRLTQRHSIESMRAHRIELGRQQPAIAHDLTELRLRSLIELVLDAGYPVEIAHRASDVFRTARNRVTPFAEVRETLVVLRQRYTLVSVTNGNSQIEETPLHDSFHHSLTAAEVGAAKPDPAIFHAASERSGIALSGFLHVGDDPVRDVQAARAIGLRTVWVNRYDTDWPDELEPADLEVPDIAQLAPLLIG